LAQALWQRHLPLALAPTLPRNPPPLRSCSMFLDVGCWMLDVFLWSFRRFLFTFKVQSSEFSVRSSSGSPQTPLPPVKLLFSISAFQIFPRSFGLLVSKHLL